MKRTLAFYSLIIALVLAAEVSMALPIRISPGTFNFGKIPQHAVANKRFWITSTAKTPVKISHVIPDCGCTEVVLTDSTIAPGDSVALDIIFHSRSFIGFMTKRPAVKLEGSDENAIIQFYAEVMVKPETATPLVMSPTKVDVSQFGERPRRKGVFNFVNNSIHDYDITVIDSSYKSFDIIIPNKIKAGESIQGQVIVHKDRVESEFEEAVTIEINDDGRSRYSIPVFRMYKPKNAAGSLSGK